MNNYEFFYNYFPATQVAEVLQLDADDLILRAMQKHVTFYFPNKSQKTLLYIPTNKVEEVMRSKEFKEEGLINCDNLMVTFNIGEMMKLEGLACLNLLGKKVLTEKEAFTLHPEKNIEYAMFNHPKVQETIGHLYHFKDLAFEDMWVYKDDALELSKRISEENAELAKEESGQGNDFENHPFARKPVTKQIQREQVFLSWLEDKNEKDVPLMKKSEVLEELRKLDPHLFMGEQKHFFRIQKIIEFKSGRK